MFGWRGVWWSVQLEREREMLHDKRTSDRCDSKTQENTHMSEVERRKKKYFINKWIV